MKKNILVTLFFLAVLVSLFVFFLNRKDVTHITIKNSAKETTPQQEHASSTTEYEKSEQSEENKEITAEKNQEEAGSEIESDEKKSVEKEKEIKSESFIKKNLISWGFTQSSSRKIDTLIIHSSYDALGSDPFDVDGILKEYGIYEVSAHYLIDRKGKVYQLVEENNIAYHAGKSSVPDGRTNVNDFSVGIEMVNTKKDKMTSSQYESLNRLIGLIEEKHEIKYILGHNEIAPDRKDDPWNFDWDKIKRR